MTKSDNAINTFQSIARVIWAATALLAPWLVVLSPAVFFGWTTYQTANRTGMPPWLAVAVGLAAAIGLETVNIAAAHAALQLSHEREQHAGKFALACGLVAFYVVIGLVGMGFLDADLPAQIIGGAMFLLAPVAIIAQALTMDLARVRQDVERERQAASDEAAWRRGLEEKRQAAELAQKHELALIDSKRQEAVDLERVKQNAAARVETARIRAEHPRETVRKPAESRGVTARRNTAPAGIPSWLTVIPGDKAEFIRLVHEGAISLPPTLTASELTQYIPAAGSSRNGRLWLAAARSTNGHGGNDESTSI